MAQTELEGIRQKVFVDRYALKDAAGQPLEDYPEQTWRRVARGIASVEATPEGKIEWGRKFYDLLDGFKFVPGGRILAGAGSSHSVTYYNCYVVGLGENPLDPTAPREPQLEGEAAIVAFYQALLENTDIMAHGGGVGINYSSLPYAGATRTSSTSLFPSRLTLGLRLDHPDILDFIQEALAPSLAAVDTVVIVPAAWAGEGAGPRSLRWEDQEYGTIEPSALHEALERAGERVRLINEGDAEHLMMVSVEDSRGSIVTAAEQAHLGLYWGQSQGFDFSALRPKGAYIKTVNGTSSGPVAWMYLFDAVGRAEDGCGAVEPGVLPFIEIVSVITGKTIQQGGSRRGAAMAMLDATHPDIRAFIAAKDIDPVTGSPVRIQHANMSVCVPDDFMTALKEDGDWNLTWKGEIVRTEQSATIWGEICTRAWATAEPGVVFMQRAREESPIGYYANIRCTNPCVTGDTLISTADGDCRADDLYRRGGSISLVSPVDGVATIKQASHVFCTGIKPVFRLGVDSGASLRLTADHRVSTTDGWVEARLLTTDHSIETFVDGVSGIAHLVSLTPDGEEAVYDVTEPQNHRFVANGLVVHNCGEMPLEAGAVCNLGSLNLSAFVDANGELLSEQLADAASVATRFLDNVIDATPYFSDLHVAMQKVGTRRIGLGTMGLAHALIKMELAYGSPESLMAVERMYAIIRDAAYRTSVALAKERGPFGFFQAKPHLAGSFVRSLPQDIRDGIATHGLRNGVLLTQPPTGTTSLLAGSSSGIEPVFAFSMQRTDRTGVHVINDPTLQAWIDAHPGQETPTFFKSSMDCTPEDHIRVQAVIQKYTDSAVSKTTNAPHSHTSADVDSLYRMAYDLGCKGVTYYRDGSRDAVLTVAPAQKGKKEEVVIEDMNAATEAVVAEAEGIASATTTILEGRATVFASHVMEGCLKKRPAEMLGYTRNVTAPEGKVNITVNSDDDGPLEVFLNVGRAGSDIQALAEALGRLSSLILRLPSTMSQEDRLSEIAAQLRGIGGSRSIGFGKARITSLADAMAQVMEQHTNRHCSGAGLETPAPGVAVRAPRATGNMCPQCGSGTRLEEGCEKCANFGLCDWSKC